MPAPPEVQMQRLEWYRQQQKRNEQLLQEREQRQRISQQMTRQYVDGLQTSNPWQIAANRRGVK